MMISKKFKNKITGEIATVIPILEIANWDKYTERDEIIDKCLDIYRKGKLKDEDVSEVFERLNALNIEELREHWSNIERFLSINY